MSTYSIYCDGAPYGHSSSLVDACGTARGAARLRPGDELTVEREDQVVAKYKVTASGRMNAWVR